MKIYSDLNGELKELDEISLLISDSEELVAFRGFLEKCINSINEIEFSHEHFSDYLNNNVGMPEIIIYKSGELRSGDSNGSKDRCQSP